MGQNNRKTYLIHRPFQLRFIGTMVLTVVLALLIFTAASAAFYWVKSMSGDNVFKEYITLHRQVTEIREVERDGVPVEEEYTVSREFPGYKRWELVIPPIIINNLIIIVIITVIGIFSSHRIAGPIFRMKKDIDNVLAGEKDIRIVLRRKDSLKELADSVNMLIERIRELEQER